MSGRGDKNKQATSGKGAGQQTGQAFADNRPVQKQTAHRKNYNLVIDEVPYLITAEAFTFNDEQRYYISVNGGEDHVFTWDSDMKRLTAIDDESGTLPEALEEEISNRLQADL